MRRVVATFVILGLSLAGGIAVPATQAGADCVLPVSGRWIGSIHSLFGNFPTSSQLTFNPNGTVTGSLSVGGGYPYSGGNISGTFDCAGNFTVGTVDAVATFSGTVGATTGSGSWTSTAGDHGTWTASADPYVLDVSQIVRPSTIAPEGAASWVVSVTNTGGSDAQSVFTNFSANGTEGVFDTYTPSQGTCFVSFDSESGRSDGVHCALGTIARGATVTVSGNVVAHDLGAGSTLELHASAFSSLGTGTDGDAAPVTVSVVAPTSLPPGEASGTAFPGQNFSTGKQPTAANPIVVTFKLPKKVRLGFNTSRLTAASTSVAGSPVPMSIFHDPGESAGFCGGLACTGDVIYLSSFSGYNDPKHPAKITITWDKTLVGRGLSSVIYKGTDQQSTARKILPRCVKGALGYTNLPCVSKAKIAAGKPQFTILAISGDPKFARR